MKNLITGTVFVLLSACFFSCNNSDDPQPQPGSGKETVAGLNDASVPVTAGVLGGGQTTDRKPITTKFEWKLMKTATIPMNKGLNLSSPFAITNEDAGDISWGSDGGCYQAIKSWKVTNANLKIVDVNTVTIDYLKTLSFVKGQINYAPAGSQSWTNYMPIGTVIAYKTSLGKYRLVVVKGVFPLVLDIYYENYYMVF